MKWKRIVLLLCWANWATVSYCLHNCVSQTGGVSEEFQKECDQLMDTLLIGWWLGKWESSDSNQSQVYNCGQHTVLLTGGGFSICNTAQRF